MKAGTALLTNQPIHLESHTKNSDGTWTAWGNLADTYKYTDSSEKISVTRSLSTPGVREYRWHYNGTTTYAAAYSSAATETVKRPSTFSMSTTTTTPTTNVAFTLTGTLKSGTSALANAPIHLERRTYASGTWGSWSHIAGTFKYTNTTGVIKLSQTVAAAGQYQYRWHYNGTARYQPAYSAAITETVKKPTTLTITNSTAPKYNVAFALSGTLKTGTTPLWGYQIHLERKVGTGSWAGVSARRRPRPQRAPSRRSRRP